MPIAKVQLPDGRIARFEVPEGTTPEQVESFASEQDFSARKSPKQMKESTFTDRLKGYGEAALSLGTGAVAAPAGAVSGIARNIVSGKFGTQAGVEEARQRAEEVAKGLTYQPRTEEGKTALADIGSLFERSKLQGLGPTEAVSLASIPKVKGSPIIRESEASMAKRVSAERQRAQIDEGAIKAKQSGYSLPPTQVNPSLANQVIEGVAGKIKTAQKLAEKDQLNSNRLLREHYGIPEDVPVNKELFNQLRKQAGQAYEKVRGAGRVTASEDYFKKLDEISKPYESAAKDFPESARTDITDAIRAVKRESFDSSSAVDQIRILREKSDKAYASGDKGLGGAYKGIAGALEEELGRHLERTGSPPNILSDFQAARRRIAEIYDVQKHIQPDGNINAIGLAGELKKGKPLQGNIRTIAEFGTQFPKVARLPEKTGGTPMSLFDIAVGGGAYAMMHNPWWLAASLSRPLVRSGITSGPYQKSLVNPRGIGPSSMLTLGDLAARGGQDIARQAALIPISGIGRINENAGP